MIRCDYLNLDVLLDLRGNKKEPLMMVQSVEGLWNHEPKKSSRDLKMVSVDR